MDLILEMPEKVTSENIEDLIANEVEEQLEALDEEGFDQWLDEIGNTSLPVENESSYGGLISRRSL